MKCLLLAAYPINAAKLRFGNYHGNKEGYMNQPIELIEKWLYVRGMNFE